MTIERIRELVSIEVARQIAIMHASRGLPVSVLLEHLATPQTAVHEASDRRRRLNMCEACVNGQHKDCPDEACPCVCNDSDFRFRHVAVAIAS